MNLQDKYTAIFSAKQDDVDNLTNLLNNDKLASYLTDEVHCEFVRAVGVYNGGEELSFVVHTNSNRVVRQIEDHVFEAYNQECILVSNNRKHEISLNSVSGRRKVIGSTFKYSLKQPNANNYTVLNGVDFYTVY